LARLTSGQKGHVTKMVREFADFLKNPASYIVRDIPKGLKGVVSKSGYRTKNGKVIARVPLDGKLDISKQGVEVINSGGKRSISLPVPRDLKTLLSWEWLPELKDGEMILVRSKNIFGEEFGNVLKNVGELKKYIFKYRVDENRITMVQIVGTSIQQIYTPEKAAAFKARVRKFNESGKVRK